MMIGFDPEHIALAGAPQRLFDVADAVGAVRRDPRERDIGRDRALNHLYRKRGLGRKGLVRWHLAPGTWPCALGRRSAPLAGKAPGR